MTFLAYGDSGGNGVGTWREQTQASEQQMILAADASNVNASFLVYWYSMKRRLLYSCLAANVLCGVLFAAGEEKVRSAPLAVVYQRQEDRTMCQSAAASMFLSYVARQEVAQQEIKKSLIKLGGQYLHSTRVQYLQSCLPQREIKFRYVADETAAWKEIRALLGENIPVILSTRLTPSGHVILAIGASEKNGERRLLVHDPWGRFDFQARKFVSKDGAKVSYPFAELFNRTRLVRGTSKAGPVSFREWYCTGSGQWLLSHKKRADSHDLRVVEEKADWRYISALKRKTGKLEKRFSVELH
jgi:hypothetical protein